MELKEALEILGLPPERGQALTPQELAAAIQAAEDKKALQAVEARHKDVKVRQLKVPLDDTYTRFAYGYIKYPDRSDISIAMTMKDTDPLAGKEIVLRNNWLEGDKSIIDDTELFLSACTALDELLSIRKAILKKN